MTLQVTNNARTILNASISAAALQVTTKPGDGAKFPAVVAGSGNWFPLVLTDDQGTIEILRATARVGDVITVLRGQENTQPLSWNAGAYLELRVTRAGIEEFRADVNAQIDVIRQNFETQLAGMQDSLDDSVAALSGAMIRKDGTTDILGTLRVTNANALRLRQPGGSGFLRNDGNAIYVLLTDKNDPDGDFNNKRPLSVDIATGNVTLGGNSEILALAATEVVAQGKLTVNGASLLHALTAASIKIGDDDVLTIADFNDQFAKGTGSITIAGTILKWGKLVLQAPQGEGYGPVVNFLTPFPEACECVIVTDINVAAGGPNVYDDYAQVAQNSVTKAGFQVYIQSPQPTNSANYWSGMYWFAIGK